MVAQVKDDISFSGLSAKDVTKRVMPFVQFPHEGGAASRQAGASHAPSIIGMACAKLAFLAPCNLQSRTSCWIHLLSNIPVFLLMLRRNGFNPGP